MNTSLWGPSGWVFLHTLTFNYPDNPSSKDKKIYKEYFTKTGDILPCKYCRESYKEFIKELPIEPALESRDLLTKWFYDIHNKVNKKLRKQGLLSKKNPSFKNICLKYDKMRAKCSSIKHTCK